MKHYLFIGFLLFSSAALQATSLDECQTLAERNYPLINQYDLISQSNQYTIQNLNRGWLPQIQFSAQATLQSDVVALPDALQNMMKAQGMDVKGLKKDQYKIALDLQQTLYDGGATKAQKRIAEKQEEVQSAQTHVDMYAVRKRVMDLYYGFLLNQERIRQVDATLKLLRKNLERLTNMLEDGIAMPCDVNALKAEVLSAEQQRDDLESSVALFSQMLNLFCGTTVEPDSSELTENLSVEKVSADNRAELKWIDKQSELLYAQERALNAKITPRLHLFAQGFYGYPGLNMYEDMFSHDGSLNGIVGVKLQWNLSNFYTRSTDKQYLSIKRDQLQVQKQVFLFNTEMQQTQEQLASERCRKVMQKDDEIIALRQSVREAAEAKLEDGIIDTNVLLQEMTREQQARIAKTQHQIELLLHIAELKYLQANE